MGNAFCLSNPQKSKIYKLNNFTLKVIYINGKPHFDSEGIEVKLNNKTVKMMILSTFNKKDYIFQPECSKLLLTYNGLLKAMLIFGNKNDIKSIVQWYNEHFYEKDVYVKCIEDIYKNQTICCIYLLTCENFMYNTINYGTVYKFGKTIDFYRRYKELNKDYGCLFKIVMIQQLNSDRISEAESKVKNRVNDYILNLNNRNEIFTYDGNIDWLLEFYKNLI